MKNTIKLLGILVLFAALAFASCSEKGGTIEVTNEYKTTVLGVTATATVDVSIYKGTNALGDPIKKETITSGKTTTFTIDEDGTYLAVATVSGTIIPVWTSIPPIVLLAGNTVKVTVE
jgi:hypothetical protein